MGAAGPTGDGLRWAGGEGCGGADLLLIHVEVEPIVLLRCNEPCNLLYTCRWKFPIYLSQDMNPANVNASGVQDVAAQVGLPL